MVLTPVLGEAATTSWPPWRRMATVFEPMRPVPPMTTIFIIIPFLPAGARLDSFGARYRPRGTPSAPDESEEVGVHNIGMGRAHAVRKLLVYFERAVLQQLRRKRGRVGNRND